jgi:hypothetical protein
MLNDRYLLLFMHILHDDAQNELSSINSDACVHCKRPWRMHRVEGSSNAHIPYCSHTKYCSAFLHNALCGAEVNK